MVFSKKWLRNHLQFLLHFLIPIDVLKLCRKFEPIPTSIFQVVAIFLNTCRNNCSLTSDMSCLVANVRPISSSNYINQ